MTHLVGPKGQVVIPKDIRDALGIRPGDRVDFVLDGTAIVVEVVPADESLMGVLGGSSLTDALEAEHRRELQRDDRRIAARARERSRA